MIKHVRGRQFYSLEMYLMGYPFEEFERRAKRELLLSCLDVAHDDVKSVKAEFKTVSLTTEERYLEIKKFERADGQYIICGEFVSLGELCSKLDAYARVIVLDGIIT